MMRRLLLVLLILALPAASASAADTASEIDSLLNAVSQSDCVFLRNGKAHDAQAAAAHLRMKYRRGKKYAATTEDFIARLASKSSRSGKPYYMDCAGTGRLLTADWLSEQLAEIRRH